MDHRDAARAGEGHRETVGDEHQRCEPRAVRGVAVGVRKAGLGLRVPARLRRAVVSLDEGLVHLAPDQHAVRVEAERCGESAAVLADAGIPRQPPQVEGVERAVAHPAEPAAERRRRAGEVGLQPPYAVVVEPAHRCG
jgi:hypothetical protein